MAGLFILGGSTYYTLLLLQSLERQGLTRNFSRIAVFGRNPERLQLIARAGAELTGHTVPIVPTDAISDCLDPEYTLLFNQMRFGGLEARDRDEKTAIAAGLPADETIGIVGVSNAIRTIIGLEQFVAALRPKSGAYTLLNFTNPCSIACQYLTEQLPARVIGICDYPAFMQHEVARAMGVDPATVALDYFGLNHFGFVHAAQIGGREALPDVIAARPGFMPDCNRHFSTLLNISWSFVFEAERIAARQRSKPNRADDLLQIERRCDELLQAGENQAGPFLAALSQRDCHWYDLAVSPVLGQLTGAPHQPVYVNCAAGDALALGRDQTVIETTCMLRPEGIATRPLPQALLALPEYLLVQSMKQAELALLAAISGREPEGVIGSCLLNPMIRSLGAAEGYFARLRESDPAIRAFWNQAA